MALLSAAIWGKILKAQSHRPVVIDLERMEVNSAPGTVELTPQIEEDILKSVGYTPDGYPTITNPALRQSGVLFVFRHWQ